jgi:hypothetical protein
MSEQEQFKLKKYDYIPLNPKLIDHVRRLDGFKDEDLMTLKSLLTGLARKMNP